MMKKKSFQADDLFCSFMLSQSLQSTMIVQGIQSDLADWKVFAKCSVSEPADHNWWAQPN